MTEFDRYRLVKCDAGLFGQEDVGVSGLPKAAYEIRCRIDVLQVGNVGKDGCRSGDRPVVFFNSSQILWLSVGDRSPETNCLRSPPEGGLELLFRYLSVFLARTLAPSIMG